MPERTSDGGDRRTDLTHVHETLTAAYSDVLADPRNQAEGLDRAVCGPHLKHLAERAAAAAADGVPAAAWRTDVLTRIGPSARGPLDSAETCMRQAGLWPWNAERARASTWSDGRSGAGFRSRRNVRRDDARRVDLTVPLVHQ